MGNKRRAVASGAAHFLPEEMMTEVFLRLPVKSILRFRAVCRSWNAVLSSDEFCHRHMAKAEAESAPPNLFFTSPTAGFDATAVYSSSSSGPDDGPLFTLDGVRGGGFIHMTHAPCRGLSLLHDPFAPAYYVFNASTRAVTRLPPCHNALCVTAGLGFDARTKKFKVVRLFLGDFGDKQHIKCEIYTLGSDHGDYWKPPAAGHELPSYPFLSQMRSLHGSSRHRLRCQVCTWWSLLATCMVRDLRHVGVLEIWKLNDYGSGGWSLEHRIDLLQHVIEPEIVRVIGSVGSCGSTKRIVIVTSKRKVIVYDPVSHTVETATVIKETHSSYQAEKLALTRVSLFQVSLVPVHQTNEERALSAPLAKATREILLRLPADYTMRCKLVCKQWLSLIEGNSFMRSYHSHNNMDKRPKIMLVGKGITRDRITRGSGFSFTPCSKLLQRARRHDIWLDTKVVCSKPCHGMNLLSTELRDYLYNPCTGFRLAYHTRGTTSIHVPPNLPSWSLPEGHGHAFAFGRKNVGLGFNLSTQDHAIVEMFYHVKDFKSRRYFLTCMVTECGRGIVQDCSLPPLPVSDMPPAYLAGVLYWMSDPRLGECDERAIVSLT
ncbi:unnamed protein product [Miscanthus lutarioriparius]|uniref:F-box domain-containing protein n=1 Tax=Miscanthus lutarioriparius TaxID=422564 RepID=A0A811RNA1_9POAL|nr:unnamed protein product [Miscanthus lutarioriparius]